MLEVFRASPLSVVIELVLPAEAERALAYLEHKIDSRSGMFLLKELASWRQCLYDPSVCFSDTTRIRLEKMHRETRTPATFSDIKNLLGQVGGYRAAGY